MISLMGVLYSVAGGIIVLIVEGAWEKLRFVRPKQRDPLKGEAHRVHSLQGKERQQNPDGRHSDNDVTLDQFPKPRANEVSQFTLRNVTLSVNNKGNALFRGDMDYQRDKQEMTASMRGTGQFVYTHQDNFEGYVFLNCRMKEHGRRRRDQYIWAVSCALRRTADTGSWHGHWFLFDLQSTQSANFGRVELHQDEGRHWLKRLFGRKSRD